MSSTAATRLSSPHLFRKESIVETAGRGASEALEKDTDEALLAMIQTHDQLALGRLFRKYARVVRGIGQRILRDSAEAEDLVQDVFIYIHRKCGVYDPTRGSASSWIIQTIYYQAFQRRMQLAAQNRGFVTANGDCKRAALAPPASVQYEQSLEGQIGKAKFREMLECLTEDQWETLRLHFFEGYTLSEIAEKKEQTPGNVRHHFYRAIDKLRNRVFRSELQERITSGTK